MEDDKRVNYKLDAINKLYTPIDIENRNDIQSAVQLQKQHLQKIHYRNNLMGLQLDIFQI